MTVRVLILFACLLAPLTAFAAPGDPPADAAAPAASGYSPYNASGYGFSVDLPDSGVVAAPGSKDWDIAEEEVAFEWYGGKADPVVLIQGRVDDLGSDIDAETFQVFSDTLLENWNADTSKFKVTNSANNLSLGNRTWNLIEVEDFSEGVDAKVYYSVFSTYVGTKIYTVSLYYLTPVNDRVFDFGKPVLQGFKIS
jgi:hypothetical protein